MALYDYILNGIRNSGYFYDQRDHETFELYLRALQEPTIKLWDSYRKPEVRVAYSDPFIQASYLLRYYPHYYYMALNICKMLHKRNLFNNIVNENLSACFFGAGPCSELSGFIKFLASCYPNTRTVIANVYDIDSRNWTQSRVITQDFIIPNLWDGELDLQANELDLCQRDSLKAINQTIQNSQIFIFQNCLNEINDLYSLQANFEYLFNIISPNSLIIIVDLERYSQNRIIIDQIYNIIINEHRHNFQIGDPDVLSIKPYPEPLLPNIVRKNLLNNNHGLKPRTQNIDCLLLALRTNHIVF